MLEECNVQDSLERENEGGTTVHLQLRESIINVMEKVSKAVKWSRDSFIQERLITYLECFLDDLTDEDNDLLKNHLPSSLVEEDEKEEEPLHDITVTLHPKLITGMSELAKEMNQGLEQYVEQALTSMVQEIIDDLKKGDFTFLKHYYDVTKMKAIITLILAELELMP